MKALSFLFATSASEAEAKKAERELELAKYKLERSRFDIETMELKDRLFANDLSFGSPRFLIFSEEFASPFFNTFEFALLTFRQFQRAGVAVYAYFSHESGELEDFTEYFIL